MKKRVHIIFLSLLIASFLVIAVGPVTSSASVTLKISSPFPVFDQRTKTLQFWADLIEKKTEGRVKGKIFPGASLSPIQDADIVTSQGIVDVAFFGSSYAAPRHQILRGFEVPGMYPPEPEMLPKIEHAIRPIIQKSLDRANIQYLYSSYEGEVSVNILRKKRPILSIADWKGLKLRVFGRCLGEFIESLEAIPVVIPTSELPMALQRETIDGAVSSWGIDLAFRLYEVAPNVTVFPSNVLWAFVGMNMGAFKGLSPQDQQLLLQAGEEAVIYSGKVGLENKDLYFKRIKEAGVTANYLSPEQLRLFLNKAHIYIDKLEKDATPDELKLYEILKQFRK